jgi:hypothetical protein
MSKKETRRAAREAFPKAKVPAPASRPAGGKYSSKGAKQKAKSKTAQAIKAPTWRRAIIMGLIFGIMYFCLIHFWQKGGGLNVWGSLLFAFGGFVVFSVIIYFSDKFVYKRKLRRLQGTGK